VEGARELPIAIPCASTLSRIEKEGAIFIEEELYLDLSAALRGLKERRLSTKLENV